MDIDEINEHIRKLKCEETSWQSLPPSALFGTSWKKRTHLKRRSSHCRPRLMRRRTPQQRNHKATLWRLPALFLSAV